jgi:hypothetical protein
MRQRHTPRSSGRFVPCEPLEKREFLAADLVATELVGRFPQSLVSGQRARIPALAVNVNNAGDADVRQSVGVRLVASADGVADAGDQTLSEQTTRLTLRPGGSRRVPIRLRDIPPAVAQGNYRLIAVLDTANVVAPEDNEGNNAVASSATVAIGPPFVNLVVSDVTVGAPLARNRPTRVTMSVLNGGNVNARGTGVVQLTFTPVGAGAAVDAPQMAIRIGLKPGQSRGIRGRGFVPGALAPGQYTVRATIVSTLPFTESNTADNSAQTAAVTVR